MKFSKSVMSIVMSVVLVVGLTPLQAFAGEGSLVSAQGVLAGAANTVQTQSKKNPWLPSSVEDTYETGSNASNGAGLVIQNYTSKVTVKNLKSSNSKVVKVSWKKGSDLIDMQWSKIGKATVTCDLYSGAKKVRHCKIKVVITKYESPVASMKLGSKDYAGKFKTNSQVYKTIKKTQTFKVSVKPKSGWRLIDLMFYNGKTTKTIKNNANVKCSGSWNYIAAYFYKKSTGAYQSVSTYISKY